MLVAAGKVLSFLEGRIWKLLVGLHVAFILVLMVVHARSAPFSPDSWSYYELSKHIFDDFYRISTFRQSQVVQPYGISFPPLYPTLLALTNSILHAGIYGGYVLNGLIALLTFFLLIKLTRQLFGHGLYGLVLANLLLTNTEYLDEVLSARSIPLALLLFLLMIWFVASRPTTKPIAFLLGLLAGLSVMTRFDFMLAAGLLGVVLWFMQRKWTLVPLYYAGLALAVSPWAIYSLAHFGTPFISDNSRTVLMVVPTGVTEYFPSDAKLQTLTSAPVQWFLYSVRKLTKYGYNSLLNLAIPALLMPLAYLQALWVARTDRPEELGNEPRRRWAPLLWLAPVFLIQQVSIGLSGYNDLRYRLPLLFYLAFLLVAWLSSRLQRWPNAKWMWILVSMMAMNVVLSRTFWYTGALTWNLVRSGSNATLVDPINVRPLGVEGEIYRTLTTLPYEPRILMGSPFRFGALTGITTIVQPANLRPDNVRQFIQTYRVNTAYASGKLQELLASQFTLTPLGPNLWQISERK